MRVFSLVALCLIIGCNRPPIIHIKSHRLHPDLDSRLDIPIFLRGNMMFVAEKIVRYIDACQVKLEEGEPRVRRSRVVVYPHRGLFQKRLRIIGNVASVLLYKPPEIKVEWHPKKGAWGYAEQRLRQAGWRLEAIETEPLKNDAIQAGWDAAFGKNYE